MVFYYLTITFITSGAERSLAASPSDGAHASRAFVWSSRDTTLQPRRR